MRCSSSTRRCSGGSWSRATELDLDGESVLRTAAETVLTTVEALAFWATGLTEIYIEARA